MNMPKLSIYIGRSAFFFLLIKNKDDYFTYKIPFSYTTTLYGHFSTSISLYKDIINTFFKTFKLTESTFVAISSFEQVPELNEGYKILPSVVNLMSHDVNWYLVDHLNLICNGNYGNLEKISGKIDDLNYIKNLSVYPQAVPASEEDFVLTDRLARMSSSSLFESLNANDQVIFSGDRFTYYQNNPFLTVSLALDLISTKGFYNIKVDTKNFLSLYTILNTAMPMKYLDDLLIENLIDIGWTVVSDYEVEILLTSPLGTRQFFRIEKGSFFSLPLEEGQTYKIHIKAFDLDIIEKEITAGKVGLFIDTRNKKELDILNFDSILHKIKESMEDLV
jgi:hypothetical protein